MDLAARTAEKQWGTTRPNPTVGAVVLDADGNVVATGATEPAGGRHAEIVALDAAGDRARGGSIIVTLEPCNHTGRTGPCASRILEEGLATVVYAVGDPNPVASGGAERLAEAPMFLSAPSGPGTTSPGPGFRRSPGNTRRPSMVAPPPQTAPASGSRGPRRARTRSPVARCMTR